MILPGNNLDTRTKAEISRAPKELWRDIGRTAQEQDWTRDETQKKVQAIKEEPNRAQEILQSSKISIPEAPADKLIPLVREISNLCEMQDQLCKKLDPSPYEWGSGALAVHVLHGLYVLAKKTSQLAGKTKRMIEFLERRRREEKERKRERDSVEKEVDCWRGIELKEKKTFSCEGCSTEFHTWSELKDHKAHCDDFQIMQAKEAASRMRWLRRES